MITTEFGVGPLVGGALFGVAPPDPPPPQPDIAEATTRNVAATEFLEHRFVNKLLIFMVFTRERSPRATRPTLYWRRLYNSGNYSCAECHEIGTSY